MGLMKPDKDDHQYHIHIRHGFEPIFDHDMLTLLLKDISAYGNCNASNTNNATIDVRGGVGGSG